MQTGYENLWPFQNNRQEKVVYLQKNGQHGAAVLTDSNKQMQNGMLPTHSNSYTSPENNATIVHQTSQPKGIVPHYIWQQTSTYFWPQQAFPTQSNNIHYSSQNSQPEQDHRLGLLPTPNVSISQVYNNGNNNITHSTVICTENEKTNVQTPRIRVKDVFSLNNGGLCDPLINNNLYQPPSKEHRNHSVACTPVPHNSMCGSGNQPGFINLGYLPPSDPPPPPHSIHQKSFYQQSTENQFHLINNQQAERNFPVEVSNTNPHLPPEVRKVILPSRVNPEPNIENLQRKSCIISRRANPLRGVALDGSRNAVPGQPNKDLTYNPSSVSGIHSPPEINTSEITEDSRVPVTRIQTQVAPELLSPYKPFAGEGTYVKTSVPHTGRNTVVRLNESNCSSSPSLPCLAESRKETVPNGIDFSTKEEPDLSLSSSCVAQENSLNPPAPTNTNQIHSSTNGSSTSVHPFVSPEGTVRNSVRRNIQPNEPFVGVNRKNLEEFLNFSPSSKKTRKDINARNVEKEIAFQNNISLNMLKQGNSKRESPTLHGSSFPDGEVFNGVIKTEEDHAEVQEVPSTYNEVKNWAKVDEIPIEKAQEKPKAGSKPELSIQEDVKENSNNKSNVTPHSNVIPNDKPEPTEKKKRNRKEKNSEKQALPWNKTDGTKKNKKNKQTRKCKSQINKWKLDRLIEFLGNDKLPFEAEAKALSKINKRKVEDVDVNHNRRKLSKSSIVKNKNNTREMVALVSTRSCRTEAKNSSETCRMEKSGPKTAEKGKDVAEINKKAKCDASVESELIRNDSSKSEPNIPSRSVSERVEERSPNPGNQGEEKLLNSIRAFHNVRTSWCKSCCWVFPVDSFWINVATAEVKCLNCFTKAALFTEESNRRSKNQEEKGKKANESAEGSSRSTAEEDWMNLKENKQEMTKKEAAQKATWHSEGNFNSQNSKVEASGSKRQSLEGNEKEAIKGDQCGKGRNSKEENSNCGSKHSEEGSKSRRKEENATERSGKPAKSNKQTGHGGGHVVENCRKSRLSPDRRISSSKERYTNSKTQVIEDTANKSIRRTSKEEEHSRKSPADSWEKSVKRTKESHVSPKEEQKSWKHQWEKSVMQNPSKDSGNSLKPRTTEQTKTKEENSGSDSRPKTTLWSNFVEKYRKRINSGDDCKSPHKVRIVEDGKGDKQVTHSSDRTKPTVVSNEIKKSVKSSEKGQSEESHRKQFLGEIPNCSNWEKSNGSTKQAKKSDVAATKPLKESQNNKIPSKTFNYHGYYGKHERRTEEKGEKQNDRKFREREEEREQRKRRERQEWERNSNKTKSTEKSEGKFDKSQTENRHAECSTGKGRKEENWGSSDGKEFAALFEELMRKTKKNLPDFA